MKKIYTLVLILQIPFFCVAQWTKLNSGFEENATFQDLFFINNEIGFVVGSVGSSSGDGLMLKTIDGGQTWSTIPINLPYAIQTVWFTNDVTGFIGSADQILRTTDQGATWTGVYSCPGCAMEQLFFLNENTGYASYYNGTHANMLQTINGGATWATKSNFDEGYMNDIYFLTETSGLAVYFDVGDYNTAVMGTHNGGNSWTTLLINPTSGVVATDNQTIIAAGTEAASITNDGGMSWNEYAYPFVSDNGPHTEDIAFTSPSEGWIVGDYTFYTQDGGHTWLTVDLPLQYYGGSMNAVKFPSADTGYAAGYDGTILKYVDAGNQFPTKIGITNTGGHCPGQTYTMGYATAGIFNAGNVFTAQLSDSTGDFSSPVNIGSVAATSSGSLPITIPPLTPDGDGYHIRVVGSDPPTIGVANLKDIAITCPIPVDPKTTKIKSNSAKLQWYGVDCAKNYRVRYRKQGTSTWIKMDIADTDKVIKDLDAGTTYEWSVQTKCLNTPKVTSGWTKKETFTTLPLKEGMNPEEQVFSVFPNPSPGKFTVQYKNELSPATAKIMISDMLGRMIYVTERSNIGNALSVDLGEVIADGLYLITIQTPESSTSRQFEVLK